MAEKSLSALTRDVRVLYTRGHDALIRDNLDYAIDLFNQVLAKEPGLYECRRELRTAQFKKAGAGSGFFKRMLSSAGSQPTIAKAQLALHKDPAEAIRIAEQVLNSDPSNSGAHRVIAEAATTLEMPNTAVMSLEVLSRNSPRDRDIAVKFANGLADIGQAAVGEKVLSEFLRQFPGDTEAGQALKNISARNTMDTGGYDELADGQGSYRDILKDKEEAVSLEQQNRQVKTEDVADRLIREYEARLAAEPRNLKLLKDLAELYSGKQDYDKALDYYGKLKNSEMGGDATVDRAIADTTIKRYDRQIADLDPASVDRDEQAARLEAEKKAYVLAESQKRVERFPTDLQLRFELGQTYFEMGKISEAISEFQKAQSNPHRRIAALNYLAQCFAKRKMYDLAARTLQNAIKEKLTFDDEKKDLIYNLGVVLEAMGKAEEAVEQFKLIYEVDIGYRDVGARVDKYYSGAGD